MFVRRSLLRSLFDDDAGCDPGFLMFSFSRLLLPVFFVVGITLIILVKNFS